MSWRSIIERGRSMAEAHRKITAQQRVGPMARFAAECVLNTPGSEIRVGIGKTPRGITDEDFMKRVGKAAEISLANVGCQDIVTYDHGASEQLRQDVAASPEAQGSAQAESTWIVFNRIEDPS